MIDFVGDLNQKAVEKRLIENYFPVQEITPLALSEKKGRPPIFELHYYWTRKPLAAVKPILLGSIFPGNFPKAEYLEMCGLKGDEQTPAPYKINPTAQQIEKLNLIGKKGTGNWSIFDPFGGGGSIPFEGLRHGIPTRVNELNPLSWLILKATLEYPPQLPEGFMEEYTKAFEEIFQQLHTQYGSLYPDYAGETAAAYVYGYMIRCHRCDDPTPLVSNWALSSKQNQKFYIECKANRGQLAFSIKEGSSTQPATCENAIGKCLHCRETIMNHEIIRQFNRSPEERLLAVISLKNKQGKRYNLPREEDLAALKRAAEILATKRSHFEAIDIIPKENMAQHTIRAAKYLLKWQNLFTPRQLLIACSLAELIQAKIAEYKTKKGDKFAEIIGVYLSFLLGKLINRNSRLSTWDRPGEKVVQACSNKLNALQWDHSEINPFAQISGCLRYAHEEILKAMKFAQNALKAPPIVITNTDFLTLVPQPGQKAQLIITDPPYYDDAPYAELSEFFYVWYQRILKGVFPENPAFASPLTPKDQDLSVSFTRKGDQFDAKFIEMCVHLSEWLEEGGVLVMFFAHPTGSTWEPVIRGFHQAQFQVTATWPVSTESKGISNAKKARSLWSSLVIVARKRVQVAARPESLTVLTTEQFKDRCKREVDAARARHIKEGFRENDFIIVAVGIVLEIFTDPAYQSVNIPVAEAIEFAQGLAKFL